MKNFPKFEPKKFKTILEKLGDFAGLLFLEKLIFVWSTFKF